MIAVSFEHKSRKDSDIVFKYAEANLLPPDGVDSLIPEDGSFFDTPYDNSDYDEADTSPF